ncbi:MAG: hypothetical protein ACTHL8_13045 [Burkholderiaceae bacterium]
MSSSRERAGPRDDGTGDAGHRADERRELAIRATPSPRPLPQPPDEAWHVVDAHDPGSHPYSDADSDSDPDRDTDRAPARAPQPRLLVALLIGLQAMAALAYGAKYAELARAGGIYGLATALALPAALALYAGAVLLLARPGRGRALFFIAAVGLGLSIPAWGVDATWTWPVAAGAMLALAGAWYARAEVHVPEDAEAQP